VSDQIQCFVNGASGTEVTVLSAGRSIFLARRRTVRAFRVVAMDNATSKHNYTDVVLILQESLVQLSSSTVASAVERSRRAAGGARRRV